MTNNTHRVPKPLRWWLAPLILLTWLATLADSDDDSEEYRIEVLTADDGLGVSPCLVALGYHDWCLPNIESAVAANRIEVFDVGGKRVALFACVNDTNCLGGPGQSSISAGNCGDDGDQTTLSTDIQTDPTGDASVADEPLYTTEIDPSLRAAGDTEACNGTFLVKVRALDGTEQRLTYTQYWEYDSPPWGCQGIY